MMRCLWHLQRLNTDFVGASLFIYCKQRILLFFISGDPPTHTHASESPWVGAWAGLPPLLKAGCRWKIYALKTIAFHLKCCGSSDDAPTDGAFAGTELFLTAGVRVSEKEGDVSTLFMLLHRLSLSRGRVFLPLPCRCVCGANQQVNTAEKLLLPDGTEQNQPVVACSSQMTLEKYNKLQNI